MKSAKSIEPWYLIYGLMGIIAAGILPMLLPQYINNAGSAAQVGMVMAVLNIGGLSAPLWGYLADKQLHKPLVLGALAVTGVSSLLMAISVSAPAWLIFRLLARRGDHGGEHGSRLADCRTSPTHGMGSADGLAADRLWRRSSRRAAADKFLQWCSQRSRSRGRGCDCYPRLCAGIVFVACFAGAAA